MGAIESINDPSTESEELESIKMFIEILLADGGLWGETFNAHDVVTTQLKQKIIELYNSI